MPLREFGCPICGFIKEVYHPAIDAEEVMPPSCTWCGDVMDLLYSVPNLDTETSFKPFDVPIDGQNYHVGNLHELRALEKSFEHKGLRFDAWSENPNSEEYGPKYHPREEGHPDTPAKKIIALPTVK